MPSSFTHAFAGCVIARHCLLKANSFRLIALCIGVAIFPDADVVMHFCGFPDTHMLGHRGITHSIPFAVLFALLLTPCGARFVNLRSARWKLFFLLLLCLLSHPMLDAFTNSNTGVALLAPFDNSRFKVPNPLLIDSPLVDEFYGIAAVLALSSEFCLIWFPYLLYLYWRPNSLPSSVRRLARAVGRNFIS